jgi:hypothetical protein
MKSFRWWWTWDDIRAGLWMDDMGDGVGMMRATFVFFLKLKLQRKTK